MTYRILSLDGGGIRGLLTTVMIQRLSAAVPGWLDKIDCVAGTSTGGILALAIAHGLKPDQLKSLYYDRGHEIFDTSWMREVKELGGLTGAKYDNEKLRKILEQTFGAKKLGDLATRVVIPTFNLSAPVQGGGRCWAPRFMHNFDHPDNDAGVTMVEAALRTSAAPTYFPTVGSYIDGGVVANDPSMIALGYALDLEDGTSVEHLGDVALLSLGTGIALNSVDGTDHDWGDTEWVQPLINLLLDANVTAAEKLCRQFLGDQYCRVSPVLPKPAIPLDDCSRRDDLVAFGQKAELDEAAAWLATHWMAA